MSGDGLGTSDLAAVRAAVRTAGLAELCWLGADQRPRACVVVPLWYDGAVWLARTYAEREETVDVALAGRAALALSDAGHAAPGLVGQLLQVSVSLVEDAAGHRFGEHLLVQQLAKHPPSRALADSVVLRREHWWFVPRLLLRLDVETRSPLAVRDPRASALLVTSDGRAAPGVRVVPLATGAAVPCDGDGAALLLAHDASADLERTVELRVPGRCRDGGFVPDAGDVPALPPLPGPLGLTARWRRQRELRRACVAGLAAAGHA